MKLSYPVLTIAIIAAPAGHKSDADETMRVVDGRAVVFLVLSSSEHPAMTDR